MRYIRYACIALFGLALIAVSLANRELVTVKVLPDEVAGAFAVNPTISLPLFAIIFGGILIGVLVGFIWEWLRESRIRSEAGAKAREVRKLEREVDRLKGMQNEGKDEVLALLEETA
jgi:hypothetical protein